MKKIIKITGITPTVFIFIKTLRFFSKVTKNKIINSITHVQEYEKELKLTPRSISVVWPPLIVSMIANMIGKSVCASN
jgi:hypothetical protein